MMPESRTHLEMVGWISRHVREEFNREGESSIITDTPDGRCPRPPVINGHIPDVYWEKSDLTMVVIGEAKTAGDIGSDRSMTQIAAYFSYLADGVLDHGEPWRLILAVPWMDRPFAVNLVGRMRRGSSRGRVMVTLLTEMGALEC